MTFEATSFDPTQVSRVRCRCCLSPGLCGVSGVGRGGRRSLLRAVGAPFGITAERREAVRDSSRPYPSMPMGVTMLHVGIRGDGVAIVRVKVKLKEVKELCESEKRNKY